MSYWTVALLINGRSPLPPWGALEWKAWNFVMHILGAVVSVVLAIVAMARCGSRYEYLLLAVWKLTLSVTLSGVSISRTFLMRKTIVREGFMRTGLRLPGDRGWGEVARRRTARAGHLHQLEAPWMAHHLPGRDWRGAEGLVRHCAGEL